MTYVIGFLMGSVYLLGGLLLMITIDEYTGRVTRFIGRSRRRPVLALVLWPVVLPFLALPRYRPPRGATLRSHIKPFVKA